MTVRRATFRLYPNTNTEQKLRYVRKLHKDLYNAAVCNRKTQYQKFGHNVDYYEQQNSLPAFKQVWTEYKQLGSHTLQATLKRVDFAFQRFFKGLGKSPKFKSIRHYSGWTYPDKAGWKCHSIGDNGYLELTDLGVSIQMRGKARIWGTPTTCTIVYRNSKWYASITVELSRLQVAARQTDFGSVGIDFGCKSALAITDGENHTFVEAPKFLRTAEGQVKHLSKRKRRKRPPNRSKRQKASRRWKKAQAKISKVMRKVGLRRSNWVHQVASDIVRSNSFVATEKLEVLNMTRKVKPSQTCPKCGNQHPKTLSERFHICKVCGYEQDRDIAAALVMLLWALGTLPGLGTSLVDGEREALLKSPHLCGGFKQLAATKRQKLKARAQ